MDVEFSGVGDACLVGTIAFLGATSELRNERQSTSGDSTQCDRADIALTQEAA